MPSEMSFRASMGSQLPHRPCTACRPAQAAFDGFIAGYGLLDGGYLLGA